MPVKRPSFCEIYVEGYGNGLNQVDQTTLTSPTAELTAEPEMVETPIQEESVLPHELGGVFVHELEAHGHKVAPRVPPSDDSPTTPPSMSRESSSTSISSTWSKGSEKSNGDPITPASDAGYTLKQILRPTVIVRKPSKISEEKVQSVNEQRSPSPGRVSANDVTIVDHEEDDAMQMPSVHFNTETWDLILEQDPVVGRPYNAHTPASATVSVRAA
jgi:hypothetical protein